jgi:integrase/DNA-binding transcriptional regulator YhcF (GntR family)
MASRKTAKPAERGNIERLKSGAVRVRVYAGVDPLTGRPHYLKETVPFGPDVMNEAKKVRTRLLNQVDENRAPRTTATVNQLMDRYLELLDVDVNTRRGYEGYIKNHIRPLLGHLQVGKLNGETLDSFYKVLRTCRAHCGGKKFIQHRTKKDHECDHRCGPHKCNPLKTSSIRQIHFILSGALQRAVRWHWVYVNPLDQAEPPKSVTPNPQPPSAKEAAAIINKAFSQDLDWGMLIWLAMTTGARRGELCAMRWNLLDFESKTLGIRTSIAQDGSKTWEKDTKSHQQRRIALDTETVELLRAYRQQCEAAATAVGCKMDDYGRIFSPDLTHNTWLKPDTVSQRYRRMCAQLGRSMHIHQLRHYSATELISSGVDARTVGGRLGHGGGGATTLRFYTAWVSEADQRAAGDLGVRLPRPPIINETNGKRTSPRQDKIDTAPYERIAEDFRGAISCGALHPGATLPTMAEIADQYGVSFGTAQRALAKLRTAGLVSIGRGRRAIVSRQPAATSLAPIVELKGKRSEIS